MELALIITLCLLVAKVGFQLFLNRLNASHAQKNADKIPDSFKESIDKETYQKSTQYTLTNLGFGALEMIYDSILIALTLIYALPYLYEALTPLLGETLWAQGGTLIIIGILLSIPGIPLEWWQQFKIEEKFGFNNSSMKLWVSDKIKGLMVGLVIGYPMICALLAFFNFLGDTWWIWASIFIFIFQLLMTILAPRFIMPLFNKLSPLEDGELKDRLMKLADETGFKAQTIQVIDGSKRSGHSNAFFTGFGKFRRIVLYDTLIDQLTTEELEAVLAHEIGHYKKGHVPKMFVMMSFSLIFTFWVISLLLNSSWFYPQFGFSPSDTSIVPALLLFSIISGLITFWVSPLFNIWSRKNEYEADEFAKNALSDPKPLIDALHKLSEKNLSNLVPHPFYSGFYYSHPTTHEREKALLKN